MVSLSKHHRMETHQLLQMSRFILREELAEAEGPVVGLRQAGGRPEVHYQLATSKRTTEEATLHAGRNGFPRAPSKSRHTGTIASPNPLRILLETSTKKSPTARASTPKVATDSTRKWPKAQPHLPLSYL